MKNLIKRLFGIKKNKDYTTHDLESVTTYTNVTEPDKAIEMESTFEPVIKQYQTTDKTLDILIVEDNEKHLADAKSCFDSLITKEEKINVQYATNYIQAEKIIEENTFDGIICDIFFPYQEGEIRNDEIAEKTYQVLKEKGSVCDSGAYPLHNKEIQSWRTGKGIDVTIPLGVLVTETAIEKIIPLVFCTDTNHHGYKTEPVNIYSKKQKISLIDNNNNAADNQNEVAHTKSWPKSIIKVIDIALYKIIAKEDYKKHQDLKIELGKKNYELDENPYDTNEFKQYIQDLKGIDKVKESSLHNYLPIKNN